MTKRVIVIMLVAFGLIGNAVGQDENPAPQYVRCGTVNNFAPEDIMGPSNLKRWVKQNYGAAGVNISIPVAFHVVWDGVVGNVPNSQLQAQINVLNTGYAHTGFSFYLASVDRTVNPVWSTVFPGTAVETDMKSSLAVDPAHTLNFYTANPGFGLLGWAYFPFGLPEDHFLHGVVVLYASLPGGGAFPYDEGDTGTHEVGHYLGLLHTFQFGCDFHGSDFITDTPAEERPAFGCPRHRDTCSKDNGPDPIHNFMDYVVDFCMFEFTEQQARRMAWAARQFRPSLGSPPTAGMARGKSSLAKANSPAGLPEQFELSQNYPNPFSQIPSFAGNPETAIGFQLPVNSAVKVAVYSLTGQLVRELADGEMTAGRHAVSWDGRDRSGNVVAAGVYLYRLVAQDENGATVFSKTQRMALVK